MTSVQHPHLSRAWVRFDRWCAHPARRPGGPPVLPVISHVSHPTGTPRVTQITDTQRQNRRGHSFRLPSPNPSTRFSQPVLPGPEEPDIILSRPAWIGHLPSPQASSVRGPSLMTVHHTRPVLDFWIHHLYMYGNAFQETSPAGHPGP